MIDLYFWPTPNGWKPAIMLEECGLPYRIVPVNIGRGDQLKPDFLKISPNNRIPAIIDHEPAGGGAPVAMFESGAILTYLAEKSGKFLPQDLRRRYAVMQWLFWQIGGLGPMAGQNHFFSGYASEKIPYAIDRYRRETNRLYGVLDGQLARTGAFVAGDEYTIADMACWPWVVPHERQGQRLDEFPHVKRWFEAVKERPAVRRAVDMGNEYRSPDEDAKKVLFGQTAASVRVGA